MIKLLLVIPTLDQSGAEKQFALLARGLPAEEFDVRVIALSRGGPYEDWLQAAGIPCSILHKRWRLDPRTIWKLRQEINNFQPDVVLSCLFSGNSTARLALTGLKRRPVMMISERCVDSWKSRWQLWVDRRLRSRTDLLVANSRSVADFYEQLQFPREKIAVVPNGVEVPPAPTLSRAEFLRQHALPVDAKLACFIGRLAPQKRLRTLVWSTQILRQADKRTHLILIGDGPERGELELFARDVEVSRHVRFLGHRSDASSLLQLMDVFWLASEFEGMSNSLMEAMASGKPVVVSDIPPNRELVDHERDGFIVNLDDSAGFAQYTLRLFQDQKLAARLGQAGREKMEQSFSNAAMIERYATLIRQTLSQQRAAEDGVGPPGDRY